MDKKELEEKVKPGANLHGANLLGANLLGANLCYADLLGADLRYADLRNANLRSADLRSADLQNADLQNADLQNADLRYADLRNANLHGANLPPISILADGILVVWKKLEKNVVAKLLVPIKAKRVNSTGRKCRAEYVKVLALFKGKKRFRGVGIGQYDGKTEYRIGKIVHPDKYDPDFRVECSHGIHFFITRKEAEDYV